MLHVFPIIRDHALWHERFFQQPIRLKEKQSYYKGFRTESYFDTKSWKRNVKVRKDKKQPKLLPSIQLSSDQKNLIDNIIKLFDEREIPVVFVSAPIFKKALNEEKNDNYYHTYQFRINEYLKEKKQVFLDYGKLWNELDLHVFDFKDKSHLNLSGATKVSNHLADYITKQIPFDEDEQKLKNYPENFYYLLKTNFSNTIFNTRIKDEKLRKQTGIDDIALYKDKYGRLELIMTGSAIKKLKIKTTYEMPISEARNLPSSIAEKVKGNQYIDQTVLPNLKEGSKFNGLRYNDKEFKIFTFDCPFDEVENLRISIGSASYSKELISIDHLDIK